MATDNTTPYASPLAGELVELLGLALADEFIANFKGQIVYIAADPDFDSPIAKALGKEKFKLISSVFAGESIPVPKSLFKPKTAKSQILELAKLNFQNFGSPRVNKIATATGTTARWVKYVLARHRHHNNSNLDLFKQDKTDENFN